ncbi:MAG: amine oxidase, partial [Syntrophobacteraceae bacterium]|nr:amine oxidase [Syntrophobacteraceae bacterium]
VFERLGLPETTVNPAASTLAIHDPCTTRHESHIQDSVRRILIRLGVDFMELPLGRDRTECCGYGGLMFFANRDLARAAIDRRINESSLNYVAYCAICRDFFASRGKPTVHLLDLILGSDVEESARRSAPGYSQRHENRVRLKRALLRELWGEEIMGSLLPELIRLEIPDAVSRIMEERLILEEDIRQVIDHAGKTGLRLRNQETGHLLAHHKPASVTYWVEYSLEGDTYVIHNAYSHRMEIVEESKP